MSTYNLGIDHDSNEVAALKSKLSVKGRFSLILLRLMLSIFPENEIAMLKDQLVQSSTKSQDLNTTLKETNYKVRLRSVLVFYI
jgi:glycine cleavage system regulatory protein